jgi:hypothetical protein
MLRAYARRLLFSLLRPYARPLTQSFSKAARGTSRDRLSRACHASKLIDAGLITAARQT